MLYFITQKPTPILHTSEFTSVFGGKTGSLLLDDKNLFRPLEMIAFPKTVFTIKRRKANGILEVTTEEYPSPVPLFIDSRFGRTIKVKPLNRLKQRPSPNLIVAKIKKAKGLPYIWGGNFARGIPEMLTYYPPPKKLSPEEEKAWTFQGVDCSGLLYEATEGTTPRNTSDLIIYGQPLYIEGLSSNAIASLVKPLDLIVWLGHLIIVIDNQRIIESNHSKGGVVIAPLLETLEEIKKKGKSPSSSPAETKKNPNLFVIKRWLN
jgi:hypothetical protein